MTYWNSEKLFTHINSTRQNFLNLIDKPGRGGRDLNLSFLCGNFETGSALSSFFNEKNIRMKNIILMWI